MARYLVRSGLVLDWQDLVSQTRAQVPGLVHGEASSTTQAHTDSPNQQTNQKWSKAELFKLGHDSQDTTKEDGSGDHFDHPVPWQVTQVRVGGEDVPASHAVDGVFGSLEVVSIHEVGQKSTGKGTGEFSQSVRDEAGPWDDPQDSLAESHGWVHADAAEDEEAGGNPE